MNKLVVNESKISLDNNTISLDINVPILELTIKNNCIIEDINNNNDLELIINLEENSKLIYNKWTKNNQNLSIKTYQNTNSNLEFNYSLITTKETNILLDANINNSNNITKFNIHGVSDKEGKIKVEATGDIKENLTDIDMLENIRIVMLNDTENIIIPNLLVSSNDVKVNHNATISSIDPDYLFYLSSKGISEELATKLITSGFLKNNLKIERKEEINFE